jgi:hypothetical protein
MAMERQDRMLHVWSKNYLSCHTGQSQPLKRENWRFI